MELIFKFLPDWVYKSKPTVVVYIEHHRWVLSLLCGDWGGKCAAGSDTGRAPADRVALGAPQTYGILNFFVGSVGLEFVLLTEGSVLYPC